MKLLVETFRGVLPLSEPHLIPNNVGQTAHNCVLSSGAIRPLKGATFVSALSKVGVKRAIHLFGGQYWFHWLTDVDCVRGPIADDSAEVTYFTGDGVPKVTDASIALTGGGSDYPINSYILGVPAPTAAPSGEVTGASVDPTLAEDRAYVVTFIAGIGSEQQEGPPSPASAVVVVEPTQGVTVTLPDIPAGNYNFIAKRIYRTHTPADGGPTDYYYVGTVTESVSSFSDDVEAVALGETLQSMEYDPPPEDMHSLKLHPGGFMVGASGNNLCPSVAYQPHAYPESFKLKTDYPIVGIGIFGASILVTTTAYPYLVTGNSPDSLTMERMEVRQSNVSKRGMVDMGYATAYPSPDGLMIVGLGVAENATAKLLSRAQWQALSPDSLIGGFYNGLYVGFYNGGCFILDFASANLTFCDSSATSVFNDAVTDTLYLCDGDNIISWDTGALKIATWRTKKFFTMPTNFGVAQVIAEDYPLVATLYADGVEVLVKTVSSKEPFALPAGFQARTWEIEVTGTKAIFSIAMATTMLELQN